MIDDTITTRHCPAIKNNEQLYYANLILQIFAYAIIKNNLMSHNDTFYIFY